MPDTIAKRSEVLIRLIFSELDPIGCDVIVDLFRQTASKGRTTMSFVLPI
jgi:hypothetical protein